MGLPCLRQGALSDYGEMRNGATWTQGVSPHLHVALSTYIYLHLALDSSPPRSLKNREQKEEMGYRQTTSPPPSLQVTRVPRSCLHSP